MHFVRAKHTVSVRNGMSIYRGSTHGCIYCDSRSLHYGIGHDFEDIEVKVKAIELLESALRRKRAKCMPGAGSMTAPHIPLENRAGYVRKALALADRYGFGFTLLTKSDRVLRDVDLLKAINRKTKCVVQMTSRPTMRNCAGKESRTSARRKNGAKASSGCMRRASRRSSGCVPCSLASMIRQKTSGAFCRIAVRPRSMASFALVWAWRCARGAEHIFPTRSTGCFP